MAKTANLLVDGLGLGPGARAAVLLPAHWRTATVLVACWQVGALAVVVPDPADPRAVDPDGAGPGGGGPRGGDLPGAPDPPDVVLAAPYRLDEALRLGALEVLAVGLAALAPVLADLPPGVLDLSAEARVHGDLLPPAHRDPAAAALAVGGRRWTAAALAGEVAAAAAGSGLGPSDRVLSTLDWTTPDSLVTALLAPLAAGAGVVDCRHPDPAALAARAAAERVTATAGVDLPGLRRLDAPGG